MNFTSTAWNTVKPILQEIYDHPFIIELISGELKKSKFIFYIQQDWMYLNDFSQALVGMALIAPNSSDAKNLINFAHGVSVAEQTVHNSFFKLYGAKNEAIMTPSCFHYTNFLRATVSRGNYANALAALLPCFWVYRDVGNYIFNLSGQDNPYSDWINMYSSKEFSDSVDMAIEMNDKAINGLNQEEFDENVNIFKLSTRFEQQFWDDAYHIRKIE